MSASQPLLRGAGFRAGLDGVTDARLDVVILFVCRYVAAEILCRFRLPQPAYVVVLSLDRHDGGLADRAAIHRFTMVQQLAVRQVVILEYPLDGLEIEFGRQVHDGKILVVELAMLFNGIAIALDQIVEQFLMRGDMPVEIHGHETR